MIFICYPKCSTCLKAEKYLQAHNIEYTNAILKQITPLLTSCAPGRKTATCR